MSNTTQENKKVKSFLDKNQKLLIALEGLTDKLYKAFGYLAEFDTDLLEANDKEGNSLLITITPSVAFAGDADDILEEIERKHINNNKVLRENVILMMNDWI